MWSEHQRTFWRAARIAALVAISAASTIAVTTAEAATYTYDAQGRLISATSDGGSTTYYCYDAAGNRTYVGPTAC